MPHRWALDWWRRNRRRLGIFVLVVFVGLPAFGAVVYGLMPVPLTPLMILRLAEGEGLSKDWVPLAQIDDDLQRAVLTAEDARFCLHRGFDWEAIDKAFDRLERGGRMLGASTISMQTAKNLFLWPGRTFLRKGLEAYLTVWIEAFWSKRRILEVYLNIVEWGPGIYGAEAAARHWFGKPASELSRNEAARLAAVLPNPRRFSPVSGSWAGRRSETIQARMNRLPFTPESICP